MTAGRPKFPEGISRSTVVKVRVTSAEMSSYKRRARNHGMTLSKWARQELDNAAMPRIVLPPSNSSNPLPIRHSGTWRFGRDGWEATT